MLEEAINANSNENVTIDFLLVSESDDDQSDLSACDADAVPNPVALVLREGSHTGSGSARPVVSW